MDDLISRSKLLNTIDENARLYGLTCANKLNFMDIVRRQEAVYAEQKWISVKDRLPEDGVRVLTVQNDGIVRLNIAHYGEFPAIVNREHKFVNTYPLDAAARSTEGGRKVRQLHAYQKPLHGQTVGVVFGSFAPLHQGHLDLIMRAKKENEAGCIVIVCGYNRTYSFSVNYRMIICNTIRSSIPRTCNCSCFELASSF